MDGLGCQPATLGECCSAWLLRRARTRLGSKRARVATRLRSQRKPKAPNPRRLPNQRAAASSIFRHQHFPHLPPPPPAVSPPPSLVPGRSCTSSLVPVVSGGIPHSSVHAVRQSVELAAPRSRDCRVAGHAAKGHGAEHQLMNLIHHAEVEVAVDVKNKGCARDAAPAGGRQMRGTAPDKAVP
uniref:Uncharacterized protein n=1 Tax=Setaria viridis TaxID=4556 RepID=A0A4U6VBE3_SETVI|nr:hypothetical protein SEVIR_3G154000v2 [Setaria viridis]